MYCRYGSTHVTFRGSPMSPGRSNSNKNCKYKSSLKTFTFKEILN